MDIVFLCIIIFLFILAVFDLSVGVSNDAVNFLSSALGSRAGSFRRIVTVAAVGVFIGAASSNGMMDIARHGIFHPEYFSFFDLMCVFMAVMVTDIILLDIFNSLGMPTSTTVSMVFELLGAAFIIALIKMWGDNSDVSLMDLLNTGKAMSVILGIFLSVVIAFVFGTVVQFIARAIFSFEYGNSLKWKAGLYGGVSTTAIIYFLLIKGVKDFVWMTPAIKEWIGDHTMLILVGSLIFFTCLMQLLHTLKVNVLKIVVLIGTFSLAMAFAGNDLVNFIGVPLSGFDSYRDYMANGAGDPQSHMMGVLNQSANTPIYFLLGAGLIMVVALATSKKARKVTETQIGLGAQGGGEEMFGSSAISRKVVRAAIAIDGWLKRWIPKGVLAWIDRRFDTSTMTMEEGASFDLVRGGVNLMLAGVLIAIGTSMKLPLSTTFVTFMVAMGTSLADRAWGRESAVFRITGVIAVIGGWFITAGVAFIGAAIMAAIMHWGGAVSMIVIAAVAVVFIVRSNLRYKQKEAENAAEEELLGRILTTTDRNEVWPLLRDYITMQQVDFLAFAAEEYELVTNAFINDDVRTLNRCDKRLYKEKGNLKIIRRKETMCLRRVPVDTAIENSTWFHLLNNMCMSMNYNLRRMTDACKEHVDNNFHSLPYQYSEALVPLRQRVVALMVDAMHSVADIDVAKIKELRLRCEKIKDNISELTHNVYGDIRNNSSETLSVTYVYLNVLVETQDMVSSLRHMLRASSKLRNASIPVRN